MTLLLLLLYTALPVALTCLTWQARVTFNCIDWDGRKHEVFCGRPQCDSGNCLVANDIRARDPLLRLRFGMEVAVVASGLVCLALILNRIAT